MAKQGLLLPRHSWHGMEWELPNESVLVTTYLWVAHSMYNGERMAAGIALLILAGGILNKKLGKG
ncbi:hypothetical protein J2T14_006347 [Paenibacillus harenae]|nr:hypothetical protein [Paenibacillus harenae]